MVNLSILKMLAEGNRPITLELKIVETGTGEVLADEVFDGFGELSRWALLVNRVFAVTDAKIREYETTLESCKCRALMPEYGGKCKHMVALAIGWRSLD